MTADHPVRPWVVTDPCTCTKPGRAPDLSAAEAARVAGFDAAPEPPEIGVERVLADLEAARAAATPGPWAHEHDDYGDEWWFGGNTDGGQEVVAGHIVTDHDHAADAALIVAAVNALPQLMAAVRAVLDKCDSMEAEAPIGRFFAVEFRRVISTALTSALDAS